MRRVALSPLAWLGVTRLDRIDTAHLAKPACKEIPLPGCGEYVAIWTHNLDFLTPSGVTTAVTSLPRNRHDRRRLRPIMPQGSAVIRVNNQQSGHGSRLARPVVRQELNGVLT